MIEEGKVKIKTSLNVFFNPKMELCRDISSIAIQAYADDITVCDGFCGSGIRGLRYTKENENVRSITFIDINKHACALTEENIKINGLNAKVFCCDLREFLTKNSFDFVEIDPFGSPVPFLYHAIGSFKNKNSGLISITATDTAVLCGAHPNACLKNYQAMPLRNEYSHEIGIRILLGKIVRTSVEFNLGVLPLLSLSQDHYFKVFVKLLRGARNAVKSMRSLGYISHCFACLHREVGKMGKERCKCGKKFKHAGPLWIGSLGEKEFIKKMDEINEKREYKNKRRISKLINIMENEVSFPPTFFNIHKISEKEKRSPPKLEWVIKRLEKAGFLACKTHFKNNSIKTDAKIDEIKYILNS